MKKYFGIMMILAVLLAAPAFANGPEETSTVNVTVNVSQYAEITLTKSEFSLSLDDIKGSATPSDRRSALNNKFMEVLANFPYTLTMTAPSEPMWLESMGPSTVDGYVLPFAAGIEGLDESEKFPYQARVTLVGGDDGYVPDWWSGGQDNKVGVELEAGEPGKTSEYRIQLIADAFGMYFPGGEENAFSGPDTMALAGEYRGQLTFTVAPDVN